MAADEQKHQAVRKAIWDHILVNGATGWDPLRAKFPDVSRATFYRLIKKVQQDMEDQAVPMGSVKEAQARIRNRQRRPSEMREEVESHLPASPSPAIIAGESPRRAALAFDFMAYFSEIVADANAIRAKMIKRDADGNVVRDADGNPVITNPVLMDRNISRRLSIIESWLKSQELIYNYERMRELYNLVIEAVGRADPDTQAAIVAELRALNNKRGITMDAVLR